MSVLRSIAFDLLQLDTTRGQICAVGDLVLLAVSVWVFWLRDFLEDRRRVRWERAVEARERAATNVALYDRVSLLSTAAPSDVEVFGAAPPPATPPPPEPALVPAPCPAGTLDFPLTQRVHVPPFAEYVLAFSVPSGNGHEIAGLAVVAPPRSRAGTLSGGCVVFERRGAAGTVQKFALGRALVFEDELGARPGLPGLVFSAPIEVEGYEHLVVRLLPGNDRAIELAVTLHLRRKPVEPEPDTEDEDEEETESPAPAPYVPARASDRQLILDSPIYDRLVRTAQSSYRISAFCTPVGCCDPETRSLKTRNDTCLVCTGRLPEPESQDVTGVSFVADPWTDPDDFVDAMARSRFQLLKCGGQSIAGEWSGTEIGVYPERGAPPRVARALEIPVVIGINENFYAEWIVDGPTKTYAAPISGKLVLHGKRFLVDVRDGVTGRSLRRL